MASRLIATKSLAQFPHFSVIWSQLRSHCPPQACQMPPTAPLHRVRQDCPLLPLTMPPLLFRMLSVCPGCPILAISLSSLGLL